LALLASLLRRSDEKTDQLIIKAAAIWTESNKILKPTEFQQWENKIYVERGWISFQELAEKKRISTSGHDGTINSTNGIKKCLKAFFKEFADNLAAALAMRKPDKAELKKLALAIEEQCKKTFSEGKLPYHLIESVQKFQRSRRHKQRFPSTLEDVAEALQIDIYKIGRPPEI
jgi:hypothetical protein